MLPETAEDKIRRAFVSWVIRDPYPEVTAWEQEVEALGKIGLWFRLKTMKPPPEPDISVHQAWRDGYEFAKKLALDALK